MLTPAFKVNLRPYGTVTVKHGVFSAANTYVELASSAYDSMVGWCRLKPDDVT